MATPAPHVPAHEPPGGTPERSPLRYPPFRYLVAGRIITMLGSAMAPIALAFAVLDLTGSVTALGIVVGVRSLLNVVFLLFGGVVADRLPRQLVVVGASTVAGLSQAGRRPWCSATPRRYPCSPHSPGPTA